MFPSIRLMIVAISASLLAVLCAMTLFMGMFAAFNIAHLPFSGIAAAKPSLQIAFADEVPAQIADRKPAPFGVRFQLKVPQSPNAPVIVAAPQPLDRAAPAEAPAMAGPVTNPAANAQANSPPAVSSVAAPSHDDTEIAQPPVQEAPKAGSVEVATQGVDKTSQAKSDGIAGGDTNATIKPAAEAPAPAPMPPAPAPEPPATASVPRHAAPHLRIVSREADNPASVATSPAPTLAGKVVKHRKIAIHLRVSHHLRRPRVYPTATSESYTPTTGFVQPNAYAQPTGTNYTTGAFGQQSGFLQPGFGFAPAAIKPRPVKVRRAATIPSANPEPNKNQQPK